MGIRKSIGILLAFLLLASNTGFAFSVHYCGDEIASVKPIFLSSPDACCGKKESKPMGCCKTKIVKAEKEHDTIVKTIAFAFEAVSFPIDYSWVAPQLNAIFIEKPVATYYCDANAPPLFKLYSQYVFYA